ncbi:tetratricopeptide repeat protein, partial [uncultured Serinicoccus sp.]|uniref:tetratricopeptide repeat protein n=1 Tax=uncultured Serinicoccus sp. TaxID=735514 RepID=UPI00260C85CF
MIELPAFSEEELTVLAGYQMDAWAAHDRSSAEGAVDRAKLRAIVDEADGRPGRVASLLGHAAVRGCLLNQDSTLPDLGPLGYRTAVAGRWASLPLAQRAALARLSIAGPTSLAEWTDSSDVDAARASGWITTTQAMPDDPRHVVSFRALELFDTVVSHRYQELTPESTHARQQHVASALETVSVDDDWENIPPAAALASLQHLTRTYPDFPDHLVAAWLRATRSTGQEPLDRDEIEQLVAQRRPKGQLLVAAADAIADTGDTTRPITLFADELERLEHRYGAGAPQTLPALHNLASAWASHTKNLPGAEAAQAYATTCTLFTQLIRGYEKNTTGPTPNRRLPDARLELAHFHDTFGRASAAHDTALPAINEYAKALHPEHPATLTTRNNLAAWRGQAGDAPGALTELEELLPVRERVLGPEHPDTLNARGNLAAWRWGAGDAPGAVTELEELLPVRERVLGPEHPDTLNTRGNLATLRGQAGDAPGAVTELEELLPVREQVLGREHPGTLTTRNNLAFWRGHAGDAPGAAAAFEELLPVEERVLGPEHPDTLNTRGNLARWRGHAGDAPGAVTELEELLPVRERVLGPEHPRTLTTRGNLAFWRGHAGDAPGAVTELEELLPVQERVQGPEHPDTLTTRGNL